MFVKAANEVKAMTCSNADAREHVVSKHNAFIPPLRVMLAALLFLSKGRLIKEKSFMDTKSHGQKPQEERGCWVE